MSQAKIHRLVILASGEGSNFAGITQACQDGRLPASVVALITDNAQAPAISKAQNLKVERVEVLSPLKFPRREDWDQSLAELLVSLKPDWILLAGFLKKIGPKVLSLFSGRTINIHPSLLPKHGGPGMYGDAIYKAVLESGDKETGITIHQIDHDYDRGQILEQIRIPVRSDDTVATLKSRVRAAEVDFYVSVLAQILANGDKPFQSRD